MGQDLDELIVELNRDRDYPDAFQRLFPGPSGGGLNIENLAFSLAEFQRQQIVGVTPFERWINGDSSAISHPAQMGFRMFQSPMFKCSECHRVDDRNYAGNERWIASFTDQKFWDIGVPGEDLGRWQQLSPEEQSNPENITQKFAFKTPTLWNVACRPPYMHDGSLATLNDVLDFYSDGGGLKDENGQRISRPSLSPHIRVINMRPHQKHHIIEFLKTLSDESCRSQIEI